jgi:hypothetical protein
MPASITKHQFFAALVEIRRSMQNPECRLGQPKFECVILHFLCFVLVGRHVKLFIPLRLEHQRS